MIWHTLFRSFTRAQSLINSVHKGDNPYSREESLLKIGKTLNIFIFSQYYFEGKQKVHTFAPDLTNHKTQPNMKKTFLYALICLFTFSISTYAGSSVTEKEIKKMAEKRAKEMKKEGWQVGAGDLPLEIQLRESFTKQFDKDEYGFSKFYVNNGMSIGENYDAAKIQATEVARQQLASSLKSELMNLTEQEIANKAIAPGDAASITKTLQKSTSISSATLPRTVAVVSCYRKNKNGNTEVQIYLFMSAKQALDNAKQALRDELEQEADGLSEKFNKLFE